MQTQPATLTPLPDLPWPELRLEATVTTHSLDHRRLWHVAAVLAWLVANTTVFALAPRLTGLGMHLEFAGSWWLLFGPPLVWAARAGRPERGPRLRPRADSSKVGYFYLLVCGALGVVWLLFIDVDWSNVFFLLAAGGGAIVYMRRPVDGGPGEVLHTPKRNYFDP